MPRACAICIHPNRSEIDEAIVHRLPNRAIARRWRVSKDSVRRHADSGHVATHIAQAKEVAEMADADDLLAQLKALRDRAIAILTRAEDAGDSRAALAGIREARACIETLLEVEGELDRRGVTNIIVQAEWIELRALIVDALHPFPEARVAVAERLAMLDRGVSHVVDSRRS